MGFEMQRKLSPPHLQLLSTWGSKVRLELIRCYCPHACIHIPVYSAYVDNAVAYIKQHGISHVLFTSDLGSIAGAAICERTGLPGPTVESQFLCLHKHY